jgi:hypothetical protein
MSAIHRNIFPDNDRFLRQPPTHSRCGRSFNSRFRCQGRESAATPPYPFSPAP